jgi:hypothetical protein
MRTRSSPTASVPRRPTRCPRRRTGSARQAAEAGVDRGVDRADRGGVVGRRVTERADDDRIGGHSQSTPSRWARCSATARPTARGRCEAIVDVCGMIPGADARTPCAGRRRSARRPGPSEPCSTSRTGVEPAPAGPAPRRTPPTGSAGGPDHSAAARSHQRIALVAGGADGVEPLPLLLQLPATKSRCRLVACASNTPTSFRGRRVDLGRALSRQSLTSGEGRAGKPVEGVHGAGSEAEGGVGVNRRVSIWAFCSRPSSPS